MVDIPNGLAGSRILVTGSTGFLGTALVAKILRSVPQVEEVLLLVRSKPGAPAADRVRRRVLGNNAFADLRSRDDWEALSSKVRTLDGDLRSDGLELGDDDRASLGQVDLVVHSAASVAFDAPIDEAFDTNLLGSLRLIDALIDAGAAPRRHIHVSTAYVAGLTKGTVPEGPWTDTPGRPRVDWRAELAAARTARERTEADSRTPELLKRFHAKAKRDLGPAGAPSVGARAEQLRRDWVSDRLIELGRARGQALGWPDAYAFTKALTELAISERDLPFPVTVLRPSIIESALREPFPGWIRGFRMAEPIFLMYGRGALTEFPGIPDAIVDVVPVDIVVNAILAVLADPAPPDFVHAATGYRNPMRYRDLVRWTHDYFHENPYLDEDGQPILPELWRFPGARKVHSRIRWGRRALDAAARVVERLPGDVLQEASDRIDLRRTELEQAAKYAQLYGAYAEVETVFDDHNLLALHDDLPAPQRDGFQMDPAAIDWRVYLQENHLPEITRRRGTVRRRPRRAPVSTVTPGGPEVLAVFDLEGTVLGTNVVDTYLWIRLAASPRSEWSRRVLHLARQVPELVATDRRDRGEFLRRFYRRYEGASVEEMAAIAHDAFNTFLLPRSFPGALRRVREHRDAGHRVVFLTGALDFTVEPMRPLADIIAAARLATDGRGRYTGDLVEVPLAGDARAAYLRRLAGEIGAHLPASYAYGDSISDLPMLESVGNPVAVNPDHRLARIARDRRWAVERWGPERNLPRFPTPGASGATWEPGELVR
ncbi:MAG TPA: HAD-IB family hydrolase [Actinomycetota bacterium]|nr:HAD-IB family hydrolase [Actinomycetota bacterium]